MSLNDIGHVNSRVQTDLATNEIFSDTETDLNVVSTAGFQAPCAVLIGHRDAWHDPAVTYAPEIIWVTEVPSGTVLRTTLANRGQSGTAVRTHDNSANNLVATLIFDQRNWEELAAALLERVLKAGDTMSGALAFNKTLGSANRLLDLMQGYGVYSDNTGPAGGAGNRLWVNAPSGGAVYVGPRVGGAYLSLYELRAESLRQTSSKGTADVARIASGTYTGNGASGRLIATPFNPRHVEIVNRDLQRRYWSNLPGGTVGHSHYEVDNTLRDTTSDASRPRLASSGFIVSGDLAGNTNRSGYTFDWVAWG